MDGVAVSKRVEDALRRLSRSGRIKRAASHGRGVILYVLQDGIKQKP